MAKRIFTTGNQSFTTQGTGAALTNNTYMGIQGGGGTQICDILEILISGMATASTVGAFEFAAVSTVASGITALVAPSHDFGMNQYITSLSTAMTTYTSATTAGPQISAGTGTPAVQLGINMFGGIIRWNAAPTQQLTMIGAAANTGSFALYNASAAGGATGSANAHIIYEPY